MRGSIVADPYTMETNVPNLFAGGDAVSGTASLIEAITGGKTAAKSMLRYLGRGQDL
jgi:heterodisulfide reductase subunit A